MNKSTMDRCRVRSQALSTAGGVTSESSLLPPPPRSWGPASSSIKVTSCWRRPDSGALRLRSHDSLFAEAHHPITRGAGVLYHDQSAGTLHSTTVWARKVLPDGSYAYDINLYEFPQPTSQGAILVSLVCHLIGSRRPLLGSLNRIPQMEYQYSLTVDITKYNSG